MAGDLPHLERVFPRLLESGYRKSSDYNPRYNCFAFSVHDTGQWWEKISVKGYYWPLDRDDRVEDWLRALELNNYVLTDNGTLEEGFEKVAVYVNKSGSPEHVARQLVSGKWTSKIGRREDIEHESLSAVEGDEYGEVKFFMKRKRILK